MSTTFSRKKNLPELKFLCSAHCPMLVNNPMKFHHDNYLKRIFKLLSAND